MKWICGPREKSVRKESDRKAGEKKEGKKIEPCQVYKPQYEAHAHSQPASFFLHHDEDQADREKSLDRKGFIFDLSF